MRSVPVAGGVAYLDPPYRGPAVYGYALDDPAAFARSLEIPCWVSESRRLGPGAVRLSGPPTGQGGVRGGRAAPHAEWLTPFGR